MAKHKEESEEVAVEETGVLPLTEAFGNGDLNTLRVKLNEVITVLNSK